MVHRLLPSVIGLASAALLYAQDASPQPQDAIRALRAKADLSEEDRTALRSWVAQQISALSSPQPESSRRALEELRGAAGGTERYREAYVSAVVETIRAQWGAARPDAAARMVVLAGLLDDLRAHPLLLEALKDGRAPVRTAAAAALRNLRPRLAAAGGTLMNDTLSALREAGRAETSAAALKVIYQALDLREVPGGQGDPRSSAVALLEVLEARARQYDARDPRAEGADVTGLRALEAARAALGDAERERLAAVAASMLRYGVWRYGKERLNQVRDRVASEHMIELRNHIEQLIEQAESTLLAVLNLPRDGAPDVSGRMKREADVTAMKIEYDKWAALLSARLNRSFELEPLPQDDEDGAADEGDGG